MKRRALAAPTPGKPSVLARLASACGMTPSQLNDAMLANIDAIAELLKMPPGKAWPTGPTDSKTVETSRRHRAAVVAATRTATQNMPQNVRALALARAATGRR